MATFQKGVSTIIIPKELYFGKNAVSKLETLKGRARAAVIVTDSTVVKLGMAKIITDILDKIDVRYEIFDGVLPNPTRDVVRKALDVAKTPGLDPDWIIGLGGGSSIDTAKLVRLFIEYPDIQWDEVADNPAAMPPLGAKCKVVGISTTSGTASEVTWAAVTLNDTVTPHIKENILGVELIPDIAITDPIFTVDMPPAVTASTGFDALVHAMEGYTAKNANELTSAIALQGCKMIYANLAKAYHDGKDLEAREQVHSGQMFAGLAFTTAGLGIAHNLGLQLTGYYGAPHGIACGMMMPYAARFNAKAAEKEYCEIASSWGIEFATPEEGVAKFIDALVDLEKEMKLPLCIKDLGVTEEQFMKDLPSLVAIADGDQGLNLLTPIRPTKTEYEELFKKAYYGII